MNIDDILMSFHLTEANHTANSLEQARQLLREHEAWISIDLITAEIDKFVPKTSIHFPISNPT